jgi:hypothetical protein
LTLDLSSDKHWCAPGRAQLDREAPPVGEMPGLIHAEHTTSSEPAEPSQLAVGG